MPELLLGGVQHKDHTGLLVGQLIWYGAAQELGTVWLYVTWLMTIDKLTLKKTTAATINHLNLVVADLILANIFYSSDNPDTRAVLWAIS